jgi:alkylation response protein AidB-like acyl-CoA dehydrogenase
VGEEDPVVDTASDAAERPVGLGAVPAQRWSGLVGEVSRLGRDPLAALTLFAKKDDDDIPRPGEGSTLERWAALASLGAVDLSVARAVEPHLDAAAILAEAGRPDLAPPGSTWGVFAAEGPGVRVEARTGDNDAGWTLSGTKPWCSLAAELTHSLVTAWVDEKRRGLFAVGLQAPAATATNEPWVPHGLANIPSNGVVFDNATADAVGDVGWYLRRDGFAWGGIGVAAIWYGGAVGVLRRLQDQARERVPDQLGRYHLGRADAALALRVRTVVHDAAETVLRSADHALGPGPLVRVASYADRVADLRLYLRQHHAERDVAALGATTLDDPW